MHVQVAEHVRLGLVDVEVGPAREVQRHGVRDALDLRNRDEGFLGPG